MLRVFGETRISRKRENQAAIGACARPPAATVGCCELCDGDHSQPGRFVLTVFWGPWLGNAGQAQGPGHIPYMVGSEHPASATSDSAR
jgi:hypothetical protein